MTHTFTSLRYTVERLQEAEHFLARLTEADYHKFQFELNAFLSAGRSVTFVLQKSFAHVPKFADWYSLRTDEMKTDRVMRFFLELRNISQKQGPISFVGGSTLDGSWSCRFVSQGIAVPTEFVGRDIAECCGQHLQKLARLILACYQTFPFDSCPGKAFTEEGMEALGYTFSDIEVSLGLPEDYTSFGEDKFSVADKLMFFSREIEPLDIAELETLSLGAFCADGIPLKFHIGSGQDISDDLAQLIAGSTLRNNPRALFVTAIMNRIHAIEEPA